MNLSKATVQHSCIVLAVSLTFAACAPPREGAPGSPPRDASGATVAQPPLSEPGPPRPAGDSPPTPSAPADASPIVVPANALYVCVSETSGARQQTTIEFSPNVGELCRKHPEMGPCRYERDVCRRGGGRVFAAGDKEITAQTEAEYDQKVMRVRLKAN